MAIQKPYNINIRGDTLDAHDAITVSWQVTGDLSVSYRVMIYKNSDNSLKYDSGKLTSFAQSHIVPARSIVNGIEYKITISIWNQANNSITSDAEIFQTSSRPVVTVPTISTITSPSYSFSAGYYQAESVLLRSWIVYLYDSNKVKISRAPISTNKDINYIFSELKSNTNYFIEFQVTSVKGLTGTSGLIPFLVSYTQPDIKINLTAETTDDAGVKISWKTIQIIGKTKKPPAFINEEMLDLRDNVLYLDEENGFGLDQDFTIKLWFEEIIPDVDLLIIKGAVGSISLQYWSSDSRFHLFKDIYDYRSHYISAKVFGPYFVCIQQIFYDMNIFAESNNAVRVSSNMGLSAEVKLKNYKVSPIMSLTIKKV
jgi:hypothetical protein